MLRELHITNLAVIEDVAIEFDPGFNCFTGETGSGKSLVIGAFEMLLGLRSASPAEVVRPGEDEARISGVFELSDAQLLAEAGRILDQTLAADEPLLLTRKLFASGRSSVSVNAQPATSAMVRALGELLVDIHGQHDHQYLLKPANQLAILDAFGRCEALRGSFARTYERLRQLRSRQSELHASRTLRQQQLELYEFQAGEIDAAEPVAGELAELEARHRVLSNLRRIQREAGAAYAALHEAEGSVVERLEMIAHTLLQLAEVDEGLSETAEQIRTATLTLKEGAFDLSRYLDRLELDPRELAEVEQRLNVLNRLIAKYAGRGGGASDPLDDLLAYRAHLGGEIDRLRAADRDLSGIDARIAELAGQLQHEGAALTQARQAAAKKLKPLVERQLRELAMPDATFEVAFAPAGEGDQVFGPSGGDQIEMLVQTNPGQPPRTLRKIASGGELSRIMLSLKSILAGSDRISVLVFDEIDANIGGRLGDVIGRKLRDLSAPPAGRTVPGRSAEQARLDRGRAQSGTDAARQQVLCITHLPQIAAFAQRHLKIRKTVEGSGKSRTTRSTVEPVHGDARVRELAEMMSGKSITPTALRQAREMIATAA